MKKCFCDICGKEITTWPEKNACNDLEIRSIVAVEDVCPKCARAARELDPAKILLKAWKEETLGMAEAV